MVITPDTKDWTWVLERPCPECGFTAAEVSFDDIPHLLRDNAAGWGPVLGRPDVTVRPNDHTWSALEYALPSGSRTAGAPVAGATASGSR